MPGELWYRLKGVHPTKGKISTDACQALMRMRRLHTLSGGNAGMSIDQINAFLAANYGGPLGNAQTGMEAGLLEAQDLLDTLPTSRSSNAQQIQLLERSAVIESVLVIADATAEVPPGTYPFDTPDSLFTGMRAALIAMGAPTTILPDRG